ncbi:PTS sugar transporter subunit IIB [Caproiciproducens sp.]|uniref:PTS sugar transporter subunit IIB n=1 Tax=Caproiciproducens sp. TaxID=1954376 RepID=UPI0028970580|nr:PTS sugar transporter subunit IIB [Caproiciproducens sp.]
MRIILVCNAGMSTGIMQLKLQEQSKLHRVDSDIEAIAMADLEENLDGTDAILLGPQVRFALNDIVKMVNNSIPVIAIDIQDFGLMRADHVWKVAMEAIEKSKNGK